MSEQLALGEKQTRAAEDLAEGFGRPAPDPATLPHRLAESLAWKLLNPQALSQNSIDALMDYREIYGEDACPKLVDDAIERIRGDS